MKMAEFHKKSHFMNEKVYTFYKYKQNIYIKKMILNVIIINVNEIQF